jgi:hypothetical protein
VNDSHISSVKGLKFSLDFLEEKKNKFSIFHQENDLKQLVNIIDWFKRVEPAFLDKLYEKIIRVRSQLILDTLKKYSKKHLIDISYFILKNYFF